MKIGMIFILIFLIIGKIKGDEADRGIDWVAMQEFIETIGIDQFYFRVKFAVKAQSCALNKLTACTSGTLRPKASHLHWSHRMDR